MGKVFRADNLELKAALSTAVAALKAENPLIVTIGSAVQDLVKAYRDYMGTVGISSVSAETKASLDAVLSKFAAVIMHHDAAFVAEEVAEAERFQLDLQHQARAHMLAEKKQDFKEKMQKKQQEMKSDFEAFVAKFKK